MDRDAVGARPKRWGVGAAPVSRRNLAAVVTLVVVIVPTGAGSTASPVTDVGGFLTDRMDLPRPSVQSDFPSAASLSVNLSGPDRLVLGSVATFQATPTGGSGPFEYRWSFGGVPGNWTNQSNQTFRPLQDGIFGANVTVRNSTNVSAFGARTLVVTGPSPDSVTLRIVGVDVLGRAVLEAHASGGTLPYRFHWSYPGSSPSWTNSSNETTAPLPTGRTTLSVAVLDSLGYAAATQLTVEYAVKAVAPSYPWVVVAVVGGVLGGAGAGVWLARRRRRRVVKPSTESSPASPPPK